MTAFEIIKKYLKDNGFDGLCTTECGCTLDNLVPCGDASLGCEPGYLQGCGSDCEDCKGINCIRPEKPTGKETNHV